MGEAFTDGERALLRAVLDRLVPGGDGFPGAGDLGIAAYIEEVSAAAPADRRLFIEGLRRIAMAGDRVRPSGFAALTGEEQDAVLRRFEAEDAAFFEVLLRQTYSGYYSHPAVLRLLGVDGPPQPHGHRVEAFAPGLVQRVGGSGFTYRQP